MKVKIRGYRNMLGLTQEQLGKQLGMSKQTYHNKETGKNLKALQMVLL